MRIYSLQTTVSTDIHDRVLRLFADNEFPMSRDSLVDDMHGLIYETVDSQLIYTADIRELWDDLGNPEPENSELGDHDTIGDAITAATFDAAVAQIDPHDAIDDALDSIRDRIMNDEYFAEWLEPDLKDEIMAELESASDNDDLFDAIANYRDAVQF